MYQIAYESDVTQCYEKCMKNKVLFSEKLDNDSYLSDSFKKRITPEKTDDLKFLYHCTKNMLIRCGKPLKLKASHGFGSIFSYFPHPKVG